ncbi:MAG: LPS translocon maturation chaperone LptM [Noviherbaspirillum sp.]
MKPVFYPVWWCAVLLLTGCGQTGPLYLPSKPAAMTGAGVKDTNTTTEDGMVPALPVPPGPPAP